MFHGGQELLSLLPAVSDGLRTDAEVTRHWSEHTNSQKMSSIRKLPPAQTYTVSFRVNEDPQRIHTFSSAGNELYTNQGTLQSGTAIYSGTSFEAMKGRKGILKHHAQDHNQPSNQPTT